MILTCTPCGREFDVSPEADEDTKYVAVFEHGTGINLKVGCKHRPVVDAQCAHAILASVECFMEYIKDWAEELKQCRPM